MSEEIRPEMLGQIRVSAGPGGGTIQEICRINKKSGKMEWMKIS